MSVSISIITATYNSRYYIQETADSILSQTYTDWEWLVTDDCSDDATYDLLLNLSRKDSRIKVFKLDENMGAAAARNNSIKNASGRYLAFIDSDDLWCEDKLKLHLGYLKGNRSAISCTSYELIDKDSTPLNKAVDVNVISEVSYRDLLFKKVTFGCSTVLIDRQLVGEFQMPSIRSGQDYATWLLILKRGHVASVFSERLTKYRITPGSISRNKVKKARRQWQIYRDIENIGFFSSLVYFISYAYRAISRN